MNKQITLEQAVEKVHDGMTIMFGGFLGVGSATQIIDAIVAKGVKDLTIIANDTAYDEVAHGKLVSNHQVKKAIVSHTGTNKQTAIQKNEGTLIVEYVPARHPRRAHPRLRCRSRRRADPHGSWHHHGRRQADCERRW